MIERSSVQEQFREFQIKSKDFPFPFFTAVPEWLIFNAKPIFIYIFM